MAHAQNETDQEVCLLDQARWVFAGHHVDDVMVIAVMLLIECVVQKTVCKEAALRALDLTYLKMADRIGMDYADIKPALTGVVVT